MKSKGKVICFFILISMLAACNHHLEYNNDDKLMIEKEQKLIEKLDEKMK